MFQDRDNSYRNIPPEEIIVESPPSQLPGEIRDLRISLTSACNLHCEHCHNEGQLPPWIMMEQGDQNIPRVENLLKLIEMAAIYKANTVKFTGGEPSIYPHFSTLMRGIAASDWGDLTFGIATNGLPFMSQEKFQELVDSPLSRIHFGLDSITPGENSKPSSHVGIEGIRLFDHVIAPLWKIWREQGKKVVVNTVFTGDQDRIDGVLKRAKDEGILVNVIEVNGVMGNKTETRAAFLELTNTIAKRYNLTPIIDHKLNQIYLYEGDTQVFRFYQDHCADHDCGNCRNIHVRVNSTNEGMAIIPCFLQSQSESIPIMTEGQLDENKFQRGLEVNGTGPNWKELEKKRNKLK